MENYLSTRGFDEKIQMEKEKNLEPYFRVRYAPFRPSHDSEIGEIAANVKILGRKYIERIHRTSSRG